ncbi:BSD domain-containing protein [Abortiporus biennis]
MNFLDTYDIASPGTPEPDAAQPEQSLNEEVNQVVGQLSRFWGGFRKQSQSALEAARKELEQVASQAQKEIIKLTSDAPSQTTSEEETATSESNIAVGEEETEGAAKKDETSREPTETNASTSSSAVETARTVAGHARTASQTLFSRLQSSLPPNLVSTVQSQIPEALKQAPGQIDFGQIRSTLSTEFQRVQGITRAQAEEYVQKSESLLKEASEYLKDAVKVVPPEEGSSGSNVQGGTLWDGSDFWTMPEIGPVPESSKRGKDKQRASSSSGRPSVDGLRAVATRAESLLKQLKHNPDIISVDPEADEKVKLLYDAWKRDQVDSKDGGISGKHWCEVSEKALSDPADGEALKTTRDTLVPSVLTADIFWTRYFFRVHQVEVEEERRKALIQGSIANDEDFSWEDDDDEPSAPTSHKASNSEATLTKDSGPEPVSLTASNVITARAVAGNPSTPEAQSPHRLSSEDSYDVVSSQVSNAGEPKEQAVKETEEEDGSSESDWE